MNTAGLLQSKWSPKGCKTEKGNSQLQHGQPMEQTGDLFCMCDSGVALFQSQHQYHFWRMSLMFELIARASELGSCQSNLCSSWGYEQLQNSKDSVRIASKCKCEKMNAMDSVQNKLDPNGVLWTLKWTYGVELCMFVKSWRFIKGWLWKCNYSIVYNVIRS